MKKLLPILFAFSICSFYSNGQSIIRGAIEGEIYISQKWYMNTSDEFVHAIWRSTDYGRHLTNQYSSTIMPVLGTHFEIISDATHGVLYGVNYYKLYISSDYGASWDFIENYDAMLGNYTSGNSQGELYKIWTNESLMRVELYKSIEYGLNFSLVNNSVGGRGEVGTEPNEIYLRYANYGSSDSLKIFYSNNGGQNFSLESTFGIDTAGYVLMGYYPTISRGIEPGELYLVTWHLPSNYHIYYSSNYGQTFQLQYQSDECDFSYWGYNFSAGREQGSFYVMRFTPDSYEGDATHVHLYIDYSTDYGKSFTTFFHDTDSNYDGNPSSVTHTVTLLVAPNGYGTVEGAGHFTEGTETTVIATPNEGYEFVNWTEGGEVVSEQPAYIFTVDQTHTIMANFKLINGATLNNINLFKSFPNPFSSMVTFEYPLLSNEGILKICSAMGNVIFTGKLNDTKTSFDLSHLPQGAYIYSIETNSRLVYRGILIKN